METDRSMAEDATAYPEVPAILTGPAPSPTAVGIEVERYDRGFERVAEAPFAAEARAILREPIDPRQVEVRPDGIVYLPWVWYADRLNRAFGAGAWAIVPRDKPQRLGDTVVYNGALYVLGRFVREAWGECEYRANNPTMSYASALEGAQSDCIVRCCKVLGIAKELWDPGWREPFLAAVVLKSWVEGQNGRKGQWHFWRIDRPVPWQVAKGKGGSRPGADLPEDDPRVVAIAQAFWPLQKVEDSQDLVAKATQEVRAARTQQMQEEHRADVKAMVAQVDDPQQLPLAPAGISEPKRKALEAAISEFAAAWGQPHDEVRQQVKDRCGKNYGVEHFRELNAEQYDIVMKWLGQETRKARAVRG